MNPRVLKIPTPHWTAYHAKYFGIDLPDDTEMRDDVLMTTTERDYTSPIRYTP